MSSSQRYLKSKNSAYLWLFIAVNLAIFLSLIIGKTLATASLEHFWVRVRAKDGMIAACIPLLTIVLSGLLDDTTKARLVFWRWQNPLPGCRVFTELMTTDPRIDVASLTKKHTELPVEPFAQNALWYRLYKKHSSDMKVFESHRIYLLTRDMTALAACLAIFFSLGIVISSLEWKVRAVYSAALIAQYLVVATSARNYGKRFVLNVLAEESQHRR